MFWILLWVQVLLVLLLLNLNRRFIGIEKDSTFFKIAKNRINNYKKEKMKTLNDIFNIDNFEIKNLRIDDISKVEEKLPKTGVFDLNIAEGGLILTLEGQNLCQDKIAKIDRYLGYLETEKNKAWSQAALVNSVDKGYKTAKDKEWFAQSDSKYIAVLNKITMAKVSKSGLRARPLIFLDGIMLSKLFFVEIIL